MAFEKFNALMVVDEDLHNIQVEGITVGYEFKLQYPSYRGTFLSCIESLEICVDQEAVDPDTIGFVLNGKEFLLEELKELFREYWFALDAARIRVYGDGLEPGSTHTVAVHMKHRIPYTGYFGNYMVEDSHNEKTLTVAPNQQVEQPAAKPQQTAAEQDDGKLKLSVSLYSFTPM